jgi:hypothetical protein
MEIWESRSFAMFTMEIARFPVDGFRGFPPFRDETAEEWGTGRLLVTV